MRYVMRPLQAWPRPETGNRKSDPYKVSWDRTLQDLGYEVEKLAPDDDCFVLQVDVDEADISISGNVKSGRNPRSPRVAVAFTSTKHGPMTYRCDRFWDWRGNVRAIALGLERLRLVADTGIVSRGEQYTGFKQLPAGIELGPGVMTVEQAAGVIAPGCVTYVLSGVDPFKKAYRVAVQKHHPDAGGKPDDWKKLQDAAAVLERYFAGGGC